MSIRLATPADLARLRESLELSQLEIAALLRIPTERWREYESGRRTLPMLLRLQLRELDYARRVERLLADAQLPECETMMSHLAVLDGVDVARVMELARRAEAMERHEAGCETCRARRQFIDEHVGPAPETPELAFFPAPHWVERLPPRLQAPVSGAAIAAGMTIIPACVLAFAPGRPAGSAGRALALLAGTAAVGAAGGVVYDTLARRLMRVPRIGRPLAGIVTCLGIFGSVAGLLVAAGDRGELGMTAFVALAGSLVVGPFVGRRLPSPEDGA